MNILNFARRPSGPAASDTAALAALMQDFSIEVMPRTAAKIEDFRSILPAGTRVYLAHIDGTEFSEMLAAARRLADEGFAVMPHFPARGIASRAELEARIGAYSDVGVRQALVIAGGIATPRGPFADSMQLLETGLFDRAGFNHLHVAGHPEGNRDIDPAGGEDTVMAALRWKSDFQTRTDASMAIATQFAFEAGPIIDWAGRVRAAGITLPVHIGIAGPAKLQTMIKFAMACGVGASLRVLQRRAADLSNLILPFEPTEILTGLARHKAANPDFAVERVHLFPLGGITATTDYTAALAARPLRARA
ncbi:MAG TPA: methylenetetrahydrofolate reductase [Amaricoccus sp.]|mgnify:CR=1 FL=1|uniref:methylenetetrahydrofolate reductase n=1 Tax=Amaricoccus sp. TaxID=1872485 RepID=UPI002B900232|nr:methylenetetrahydrofolate reductase [Amaricoccus sp.]HMQ94976.1 methylenetetrahydrofolate reductase [Amaricoccus sp.]HMR51400.1 methylenetetrahydrofolate reductase [Amaricoccus sp.]HMR61276.1 methylenetetrahydrofolate reductase [Amaricoccus sp.]HMT98289.1 methylenetetrahydrofolate reductase [Amaricoccus sp.]